MKRFVFPAAYVRNFIFGVEDSLVSTVGLLSGVAIAGMERGDIFVTGVILIFVEALSMTAGSFLSESSAEEYENQQSTSGTHSYIASGIMFVSYFVSGFIPLAPYMFFVPTQALPLSIMSALLALALLGMAAAAVTRMPFFRSITRMVIIGGLAILIGALVGSLLP